MVKKGWGKVPEWIFLSQDGTPLDSRHWRSRVFNKALGKTGLRKIRIHDLRHSYASLLIQAGESLAYIRDQLGHHSIKVTVDVYGHLAPEGNKEAVDWLDDPTIRNLIRNRKRKRGQPLWLTPCFFLAGSTGLEPVASGVTGDCLTSNILILFNVNFVKLLVFYLNLQPMRNLFLCFAKRWTGGCL